MIIRRRDDLVTVATENLGIAIHSEWAIPGDVDRVYAALTGDQCTITNIRIHHEH